MSIDTTPPSATVAAVRSIQPRRLTAPGRMVLIGLASGWLFDWAFYDKPLGIGALVFVCGLIGLTVLSGWFESIRPKINNLILLAPLLFFTSMIFIRANSFLTFLNVLAVMLLLMLWAHFFSAESILAETISQFVLHPILVMVSAVFGGLAVLFELGSAAKANDSKKLPMLPVLRGLLLALPILIVFTLLLGSADLIFAQRLKTLFNLDTIDTLVQRTLLVLMIAWLTIGALFHAMTREQGLLSAEQRDKAGEEPLRETSWRFIGNTETTVVMALLNLLFAAFVSIQFVYLFGGAENIDIDGYTYSEYARRGFFEMVTVAVLALMLILLLQALTKLPHARHVRLFNGLSTVMIASVTVMLVSAHQRLTLYELTYGFTELRLQSHTFIWWLALALMWTVIALWFRPKNIAICLFICMLGFVAHLNLMNPDARIVHHNFARYELIKAVVGEETANASVNDAYSYSRNENTTALDVYYWTNLSDDAVPAMLSYLDQLPPNSAETIREELAYRHNSLDRRAETAPWQSWHYARNAAFTLLQQHSEVTDAVGN